MYGHHDQSISLGKTASSYSSSLTGNTAGGGAAPSPLLYGLRRPTWNTSCISMLGGKRSSYANLPTFLNISKGPRNLRRSFLGPSTLNLMFFALRRTISLTSKNLLILLLAYFACLIWAELRHLWAEDLASCKLSDALSTWKDYSIFQLLKYYWVSSDVCHSSRGKEYSLSIYWRHYSVPHS